MKKPRQVAGLRTPNHSRLHAAWWGACPARAFAEAMNHSAKVISKPPAASVGFAPVQRLLRSARHLFLATALRGGPQKKPRHGSGAKLVLPRPWAGQGGKRPMQRMPGRFHQIP